MRILVAGDSFYPSEAFRPAFAGLAQRHEVRFIDVADDPGWAPSSPSERGLREAMGTPRQLIEALDGADALMVQGAAVTDEVLAASPKLRLVGCARGGPVNVDLAAASRLGIPVVTSPGKNADAVAELTIAFMIMLARRLPEVLRHVEGGGEFGHDNYEGARWFGHDLAGHVLGLIGFGQIGRRVAVRAQALGMSVAVFDPFVEPAVIEAASCRPVDLANLLASIDVLSLHARATADNQGLIGRSEIAALKGGAYLVNTARDTLVDEAAVIDGLRSGQLAGAAFDVASPSPTSGRHPLLEHPNVIITTHIGGATYETLHHGAEMLAAEVERLLADEPLLNVANRAELQSRTTSHVA
jgi:D-3-phosphoglycerate dehydrogenase / 2-oxoglutarate reductase